MASRLCVVMLIAATINQLIAEEYKIHVPPSCENQLYCTEEAFSANYYEEMKTQLGNLTKVGRQTVVWPPGAEFERSEGQDGCKIEGDKGSLEVLRYVRLGTLRGDPWVPVAYGASYEQRVYIERCAEESYTQSCFEQFSVADGRKAVCVQQMTPINVKVLKDGALAMQTYHLPTFCACKLVPELTEYDEDK